MPKLPTTQKGNLLRILGVGFGIAVTVGGTIGVGILRTPGMVAAQLGDAWLIIAVWVLGGVYALLGTITVAELGAMLPQAGGWYVYARRAFGEYGGFTVGWCDWLGQIAALAYLGTSIGDFAATLIPAFSGSTKLIAIATLFFFALLQWRGLRLSSQTQEATSLVKAVAFLALVGACFIFGGKTAADSTPAALPTAPGLLIALVIALQSVVVTYDGWYSAIYFTEEDRDPARNLPRSAIGGVLATIAIYLLVNLALVYALPLDRLAASPLPAADAAQTIFGAYSGQVVTALSLVSLLSIINAVLLEGTRVLFAISRDNLFWSRATTVNAGGTPSTAMVLTALAGAMLIASGTFEKLIAMAAFFYAVIYAAGFVSLFVLRAKEPGLPRPFRAWGHPWTTGLALIGSVLFLVGTLRSDTTNSLAALALIALSYPAYLIAVRARRM
jgi:APA family basic amino acid/polyamine antiporter